MTVSEQKGEFNMNYGYKLTTIGRALLTKCAALEKPLNLSGVAFGSGTPPEGYDLANVHTLFRYVADGSIGRRRHKNNQFEFTVQYDSSSNPEVSTFYLSEFMVYAKDPETGEDVSLLYGSLGDYRQPVPAYKDTLPPSIWKFPVKVVVSDDTVVTVSCAAGLVTFDDMEAYFNDHQNSGDSENPDNPSSGNSAMTNQATFYASTSEPDIDVLTDGLMLIPAGYSKDCPIDGEYVYIMQLFHGGVTAENNRTQIAFPYSDELNLGRGFAVRSSNNGAWSDWSELAQVGDHKIKCYSSLADLRLTAGEETIEAIAASLDEGCELYYSTDAANADIYPGVNGIAHVVCLNENRVRFQWTDTDSGIDYTGVYCAANQVKWIGWSKDYNELSYLPTPQGIGAVAKAGDTMEGVLKAGSDHQAADDYLVRNQKLRKYTTEAEVETPDAGGAICWHFL